MSLSGEDRMDAGILACIACFVVLFLKSSSRTLNNFSSWLIIFGIIQTFFYLLSLEPSYLESLYVILLRMAKFNSESKFPPPGP
jgi:predicted membrane metal-binding protein